MPLIRRRTLSEDAHELRQLVMGDAHFVPVLVLTLASLFVSVAEGGSRLLALFSIALFAATLLLALWRSGVSRPVFNACTVLCLALVGLGVVGLFLPDEWHEQSHTFAMTLQGLLALVILVTFTVVLRAAVRQKRVTLDTLAAALTSYLLIGVFFSLVYRIVQGATGAFFAQTATPSPNDFIYFSFVSLTTTGYGDLSASPGIARGAVIFELILGQVYLVTIISLVVSHLGSERVPGALARGMIENPDGPDDPTPDDPTPDVGT